MTYYPPTDRMIKDFYREYADGLFRCCSFLTCGQGDTQKMVQDIFMRMLSKGLSFSSDKDAKAWMMLTAYKMSRKPPVVLPVCTEQIDAPKVDDAAVSNVEQTSETTQVTDIQEETVRVPDGETSVVFPAELRGLSGKDRLIAVFYYCEGFRKAEIAKYLGWTTFMVSHRLRNIRKKILQEKGGEETC